MTLSTSSLVPTSRGEDLVHRRNGPVGLAERVDD